MLVMKRQHRGDTGLTLLLDRECHKDSPRVRAYGAVDEINSCLGLIVALSQDREIKEISFELQKKLFEIGAELAATDPQNSPFKVKRRDAHHLEQLIKKLEKDLPPLRTFIIPGGTPFAAFFQFSRAVCRRAEREIVALAEIEKINPHLLSFINRLSDLLFVLGRQANWRAGVLEISWSGKKK